MLREDNSLPESQERVAYFNRAEHCGKITISQGPYNYTQSFSYDGSVVLGKPGDYRVDVDVFDQITGQNYTDTRSFKAR